MVKIIIELDENYIEQKTNVKNFVETAEEGDVLSTLADIMSFMSLKKKSRKDRPNSSSRENRSKTKKKAVRPYYLIHGRPFVRHFER